LSPVKFAFNLCPPMANSNWFKFREQEDGEVKPFLDHLEDLRWMIIKMVITLGITVCFSFIFRSSLFRILQRPLHAVDPQLSGTLQSLGVADSMTISFQLAFYAGVIIAFPFLLFFLAEFVLPALTRKERKIVFPAVGIGFGLFLAGAAFSYYIVLPQTLAFFHKDATDMNWVPTWTVREYFSFVTNFTLAFGLSFETPVAVLALVKMGVLNYQRLTVGRPYALVLIFFVAAVITPTSDVLTLMLMGCPMYILFEICIWIAWLLERRQRTSHGEEPSDLLLSPPPAEPDVDREKDER
jgi:sec-independent protein translocase protein TatC